MPTTHVWISLTLAVGSLAACNSITTPAAPAATVVLQRPDTLVVPGAEFDTVAIQVRDDLAPRPKQLSAT